MRWPVFLLLPLLAAAPYRGIAIIECRVRIKIVKESGKQEVYYSETDINECLQVLKPSILRRFKEIQKRKGDTL